MLFIFGNESLDKKLRGYCTCWSWG